MMVRNWLRIGLLGIAGCVLATGLATPAQAVDPSTEDLLKRLDRLEQQNQDLKKELDEIKTNPTAVRLEEGEQGAVDSKEVKKIVADYLKDQDKVKKAAEAAAKTKLETEGYEVGSDTKLSGSYSKGLFAWQTANKDFLFHVGGRINYDTVFWDQPTNLKAAPPVGIGPLEDGMFFRRLRLLAEGRLYETFDFVVEVDFEALDQVVFDECSIGVTDVPFFGTIRAGQIKLPQGLESYSSSRFLEYMERGDMFDAFFTEFAPGIFFTNAILNERMTYAGWFGRIPLINNGADFGDGEYAATGRVSFLPVYEHDGRCLLHLGASYQWRDADRTTSFVGPAGIQENQDAVRFRARAEIRDSNGGGGALGAATPLGNNNRWVDTGNIIARNASIIGTELLALWGPLDIMGEYAVATVNDAFVPASPAAVADGNVTFSGGYISVGYFLTGENRTYDRRTGRYGRTTPHTNFWLVKRGEDEGLSSGWGAWKVLYRYSYLDLNDQAIRGGMLTQHTVGLNWYLNPNMRVMWNVLFAERDMTQPNQSGDVVGAGIRFHLDF
jgi:phosphate-selective porin OprO/OprP